LKQPELHECAAPTNSGHLQTDRHQRRQARWLADGFGDGATSAWMLAFQRSLFALSVGIMLLPPASLVGVIARASARRDLFAG